MKQALAEASVLRVWGCRPWLRTHKEMSTLKHSTRSHKDLYVRYTEVQSADDRGERKMELRVGSRGSVRGVKGLEDQSRTQDFQV